MKKSSKKLLLLGVVLLVLVGAYFAVGAISAPKKDGGAPAADIPVGNLSEPVSMTYTNGSGTLSFYKEGDTWYDKDAPDFPLDQTYPVSIASNIQLLTATQKFNLAGDPDAYGLKSPAITLSATDKNGKTLDLLVGNGTQDCYYAMEKGGTEIYTIRYTLVAYLQYDLYRMIKLETFNVYSESKLTDLTLQYGGKTLSLVKEEDTVSGAFTWDVIGADGHTVTARLPVQDVSGASQSTTESADVPQTPDGALSAALAAIEQMFFDRCVNYKATGDSLATYGLDHPALVMTVGYKDDTGAKKTDTLRIGAALEDKSGYYAVLNDSTAVNALGKDTVAPIMSAAQLLAS